MSSKIKNVMGRAVLDCKGKPMLEVDVILDDGTLGRGAAPSGVSAGIHEAFVLRDGDKSRYDGTGVTRPAKIVNEIIAPALIGMDVLDQEKIDDTLLRLDGTRDKSNLGGNTLYSVSLGCVIAAAQLKRQPLYGYLAKGPIKTIPLPTVNCFSGGSYQKNSMPLQECTIVPYKAKSIEEAVHIVVQIYGQMPNAIKDFKNGEPAIPGTLSSWQCPSQDPIKAFEIIEDAAKRAGFQDQIAFAADCAASEFYDEETGLYDFLSRKLSLDELLDYYEELTKRFNFLYFEDPVHEDDWAGWQKAKQKLSRTILIGDDLTVTQVDRLQMAVEKDVCSGFIFKPNQVGTVTECLAAQAFAHENGLLTIPSVRAGGSTNDSIADMGLAFGAAAIKHGPPRNGHSIHCINTLLRAGDLNPDAKLFDFTPHIRF